MDDLECEICCTIYNNASRRPKVLSCGHTFCSQCMAKEISKGKSTCPTCRKPHNATSVGDLTMNVIVERLIRNMPKTSTLGANSCDSEEEDDDYSGGPCSTHKKSVVYFFCESHSLLVCRECTVIDHPVNKCKIVSFKETIERKKVDNIHQASSTVTAINDTLTALGKFVKEKDEFISRQELKIQQCKKEIENATKTIAEEKIVNEKAKEEIAQGKVRKNHIEATKNNLQSANSKKTIIKSSNAIETASSNGTTWFQDVSTTFNLLHKITFIDGDSSTPGNILKIYFIDGDSSAPVNILKGLDNGMDIYACTTINGSMATSKLAAKNDKLHVHHFKYEALQEEIIRVKYDKVLSHLPRQPPTLLFLDLRHKNVYQGRVYIRLQPELNAFIKNIPATLLTGEKTTSVLGSKCINGSADYNLRINIQKTPMNDLASLKEEDISPQYGEVFCSVEDNAIYRILIYFGNGKHTYSVSHKIGCVESGLEVAMACKRLGDKEQIHISITDCGLALEM